MFMTTKGLSPEYALGDSIFYFFLGWPNSVVICYCFYLFMYQLDFSVSKRCSVLCTGRYTTKNEIYDVEHCVGFNITFNLNTNYPTKLQDVPCGISGCILEVIDFECFNESLRNRNQGRDTECTGNSDFELFQLLVTVKKTILSTHFILISFWRASDNSGCQPNWCSDRMWPWNMWIHNHKTCQKKSF